MGKDYYKILGVDKSAGQEEIKKAFRKLAHEHHPDKKDGNEDKFKEANEAYQVLGNEEKRKKYDQFGSTFDQQGGFGQGMGWDDFMRQARGGGAQGFGAQGFDMGDLGDIFGDMFGFGSRQARGRRQSRGADMQVRVDLSFRDAAFGTEKEFEISKKTKCEHCSGNGAEPGTKVETCSTCQGQGQVARVQQTILGSFQSVAPCPKCRGAGSSNERDCKECRGVGAVQATKKVRVKIPAGIDNGETIRLTGEGQAGERGAAAGDLYVTARVLTDKDFRRERYDVHSEAQMSISQAVLGGKISVKTIDGEVSLKIPEGTPSGKVFKLRGKGISHVNSARRGDHFVTANILIPKKLSRKQKSLLKDLAGEGL